MFDVRDGKLFAKIQFDRDKVVASYRSVEESTMFTHDNTPEFIRKKEHVMISDKNMYRLYNYYHHNQHKRTWKWDNGDYDYIVNEFLFNSFELLNKSGFNLNFASKMYTDSDIGSKFIQYYLEFEKMESVIMRCRIEYLDVRKNSEIQQKIEAILKILDERKIGNIYMMDRFYICVSKEDDISIQKI